MFDSLYSEVWWMETGEIAAIAAITASVISSGATIFVARHYYKSKIENALDNVKVLLPKIESLSKENALTQSTLSKEHGDIGSTIRESVSKVEHRIIEYVAKDELRYDNLNEKQKDIVNTVTNVQAMANEIKYLASENKALLVSLDKSNEQVKELKQKIRPERGMER